MLKLCQRGLLTVSQSVISSLVYRIAFCCVADVLIRPTKQHNVK